MSSQVKVYPALIGAAIGGYFHGGLEQAGLFVVGALLLMSCLKYLLD